MKIGVTRPPTPPYPVPDVDGALIAKHAEHLGFESIFFGEHPVTPLDEPGYSVHAHGVPYFQDPLTTLARASGMTSRIMLGGGVFLLPEHNPVMFAKQLANLDHYSGGRVICGGGVGWSRLECELCGGDFDRRWAQTRDFVGVMKALWTQERATYEGEFFTLPPTRVFPGPVQPGGPPVLLGGKLTDRMVHRVAEYADGWIAVLLSDAAIESAPALAIEAERRLSAEARRIGRAPADLSVTLILRGDQVDGDTSPRRLPGRDVLLRLEDTGVDRICITLPTCLTERDAEEALERIAERAL